MPVFTGRDVAETKGPEETVAITSDLSVGIESWV